jgi:TRAP transporter 4TM/12TM fusion protein
MKGASSVSEKPKERKGALSRYDLMPKPVRAVFLATTLIAIILFCFHYMGLPIFGYVLSGVPYYYILFCCLGFNVFMGLAVNHYGRHKPPPWYDYVLSITLLVILVFFAFNSNAIAMRMWTPAPDAFILVLAVIIGLISLEAGRRIGSWGYLGILLFSIIYPLVADYMPGLAWGVQQSFSEVFSDFAFGANGLLGIPAVMLGELVLGFYLFAGFVMGMGAGDFFVKLATSLMGHVRGGIAKVSVISSALLGTLSGSTLANIVSTGTFTIPAMKKSGYPPEYAAAVEACSSNIGDTMPPILGGMVFMAAVISGVPYAEFVIAAVLPSLLYVVAMLAQVDGYAAKHNLKGISRSECPRLLPTLKEGWIYLVVVAFLSVGLVYMRLGAITPVYATVLTILLSFTNKKLRPTWKSLEKALAQMAGLINFVVGVTLSMGFVLVGLFKTGVAASITSWIVSLGEGNAYLVLFIATAFALVMGMIGLQRAAFLFLAVTAAPGIAQSTDVPIQLILLFIIYQAGYGAVTPPVAVDAYVAASIAGADPIKTAWTASRMAIALFLMPFFFVLQPSLAMQGPWYLVLYHFSLAAAGIWVMTSGIAGYLIGIGKLNTWERGLYIVSGFLVAFPETYTTFSGAVLTVALVITSLLRKRLSGRNYKSVM